MWRDAEWGGGLRADVDETSEMRREFDPSRKMKCFFCIYV
ncbi:Uncharacterised protein [Raoultella terrigena]|uniref:Uncharacterized protein n=1 Tax=Raoultella terrigena TaxID=577 RepID=A0A4U9D518_RAOTE|nr:Uncharacterised protein [Raoultella terrigena]